jgi:predicted DsbA family dithiol-disulfide isomerase
MHTIDICITSDFICPWCWVGYKHLSIAVQKAGMQEVVKLHFLPFELNPDMPQHGMDRREYRVRKFGTWENAHEKDRTLVKAGHLVGLEFNYESIALTPNTRAAHRLMHFAQAQHKGNATVLYERLFSAYFNEGKDTGNIEVLSSLANESGYDRLEVERYLASNDGEQEVIAAEQLAIDKGIASVPFYEMEGHALNGAQPESMFTEILLSRLQTGF